MICPRAQPSAPDKHQPPCYLRMNRRKVSQNHAAEREAAEIERQGIAPEDYLQSFGQSLGDNGVILACRHGGLTMARQIGNNQPPLT